MPYLWAWGFKSPLRHHMTRAKALVIGNFTSARSLPKTHLSAICQRNSDRARCGRAKSDATACSVDPGCGIPRARSCGSDLTHDPRRRPGSPTTPPSPRHRQPLTNLVAVDDRSDLLSARMAELYGRIGSVAERHRRYADLSYPDKEPGREVHLPTRSEWDELLGEAATFASEDVASQLRRLRDSGPALDRRRHEVLMYNGLSHRSASENSEAAVARSRLVTMRSDVVAAADQLQRSVSSELRSATFRGRGTIDRAKLVGSLDRESTSLVGQNHARRVGCRRRRGSWGSAEVIVEAPEGLPYTAGCVGSA